MITRVIFPITKTDLDEGMMICPDCDGRCIVPSRNPDRDQICPACHGEGQIEVDEEDDTDGNE